jgi:hypothetical protein
MAYIYDTSWVARKPYSGGVPSQDKIVQFYLNHYRNRCLLDRLSISVRDDFDQAYQVEKEITVCDNKVTYWSRQVVMTDDLRRKMVSIKVACQSVNF